MSDNHHPEMYAWADLCRKEQAKNVELEAENAYLRERHAEAVAQLQSTIEVLEGFNDFLPFTWWETTGKPHLDHLKTLAKEAEV